MTEFLIAAAAFLLGGFVKGVLGFGFPIVVIAVMALTTGLLDALALVVLPAFVTNIWQALAGPYLSEIVSRMWLYFAVTVTGILSAGAVLTDVHPDWLTATLGIVLVLFAASRLADLHISVPPRHERTLSVTLGLANGLLIGFTGVFMVPSVIYMQALGFNRDMLVQALGLFFALTTLTLTASLGANGLIDWHGVALSVAALVPSFAGIYAGRWMRRKIDEALFQRIYLVAVLLVGAIIAARSLLR